MAGKTAGWADGEHIKISIDNRGYYAHRLAWFYVYGVWPTDQLDHIDCNGKNNSIRNLREASNSQNLANRSKTVKNTTGFKGVTIHCGRKPGKIKYMARLERKYLGLFDTAELAHEAYLAAAKLHYGEFARG